MGHLGEQIRSYVGSGKDFGLVVQYSFDGDTLLGTGGALYKARNLLDDVFWVTYGDSYLDIEMNPVYEYFIESKSLGLMTVRKNDGVAHANNTQFQSGRIIKYDKNQQTPEMKYIDFGYEPRALPPNPKRLFRIFHA